MTFMNQKLLLLLVGLSLFSVLSLEFHVAYAADPPDRPIDLQAIPVSPTRIDLFWNPPENNGGSPITGYKIQVRTGIEDFKDVTTNPVTGTTYSHTGLTTGTTYIYHVSAINAQGAGIYSTEMQAKPTSSSKPFENIVPNTPTSFTASDLSSTSIKLTWVIPAVNNGPPVTGYKIEFKKDSGSYTVINIDGSTITTYTHLGLTTNSKYTYKISAKNSIGFSPTSNEVSATPKSTSSPPTENIVPNPPKSLTAESAGPTQIFLSWKEPTPNNGPAITGYKIESKTTTGDYTVITTTGITTSYTHTGLTTGSQYSYRVFAINSAGTSIIASNVVSAKPSQTLVPTNLIADDISPTEILLTWTAPSQTFGGNIVGYIISKKFAADVYDPIGETNGQQTSYTVTGLHTGETYTFVVKARYNIGTSSDNSSPASATPTASSKPPSKFTVPNAPTGLTVTAPSPIQIDLVWNAPTNDGGSQITGYKIDVKTGTEAYVTLKENTGSTARTYTHAERTTGTTYTYKVYAINSVGTSGPSNEASATPAASSTLPVSKTKPSQPSSLVATAVSQNQINLSWKLPTNDGGEPISGYKIEASEGVGNYQVLSQNAGKNPAYSHTGLKPGISYYYRVYAINSIGTSSSFADASTTTKEAEKEPEPEPTIKVPDFIDPKKGAQYYLDRYSDEPAYKKWFDTNYPDYTIEEAIELAIPGSFSEDSAKPILPFVDPKKDPQYYIDRYNNEAAYKKWFDENFPDYTIFEAVGVEEPDVTEEPDEIEEPEVMVGVCGPGTVLVDGYCEAEESKSGGGCLIATATFGSELSPQVQSLRELRDNTLLQTNSGSSFMNGFNQFYYLFSPTVADIERENPLFKEAVKITITPMISSLSILNYTDIDSEQEMLVYGLGVILLNIGMYFALPTFAILAVKRNLYHKSSRN